MKQDRHKAELSLEQLASLLRDAGPPQDDVPPIREDLREWRMPPPDESTLALLRFTGDYVSDEMAFRVLKGRADVTAEGHIGMGRRAVLSFDAFFNSFYEAYWTRHAPLRQLRLRLFGEGEVRVTLFRQLADGSVRRIARRVMMLDPHAGETLSASLEPHAVGAGRLYFDVESGSAGAVVLGGCYETDTPARRSVRFGIGLCTFNREEQIARNLRRLLDSGYVQRFKPEIVVVNQGQPFGSAEMQAIASAPGVRIIEQANLGGAGGFTRAALEIVKSGACSHVLFMDDDIELDPAILVTTHAFAGRTAVPTVVGGAMIDLYRPSIMYEAGAVVGEDNILRAQLHNVPLHQADALAQLAREVPCHFNGWWFCAIPVEAFADHGWPMPVFIRGDDMEFGMRLAERGMPTVSLPPVSVWHEPFYGKPPGWHTYYDLRNRLIFAACHSENVRLDPSTVIVRRLADSLLKHNYMTASLVIRAVGDFLGGPGICERPMDELHKEIVAITNAHAPQKRASSLGLRNAAWREPAKTLRPAQLLAGLGALTAGSVRHVQRPELVYLDQWHPGMTMGVSQYALSDRMGAYVQVYRYDRERLRTLLGRSIETVKRYRREGAEAAARWRAAHSDLTTRERWEAIFSRPSL